MKIPKNIHLREKGYKGKLLGCISLIYFISLGYLVRKVRERQNTQGIFSRRMVCGTWIFDVKTEVMREADKHFLSASNNPEYKKLKIFGRDIAYSKRGILWQTDPVSKKTWKKYFFKLLYPVADIKDLSDCKMPWELSRFQHLPFMAKAYITLGDDNCAKQAIYQIEDWIKENPCPYGINWTCAMEVAIRACNWIWAWWAFKDEPEWTKEFDRKFLKSMWQHGWYIEKNLENKGGIETNHYLSDVAGLLFIGVIYPQFKDSGRWKNFGVKELYRCMEEMVYDDGVSFENSTAYQRLVMELFTYSAILCRNNGIELPQAYWQSLERMFEFIMHTMKPDGLMPMIGDSDDGRLFILSNYYDWDRWDFRYLLSIGAVLFRRRDFKTAAGRKHIEIEWLFGEEEIRQYEAM